MITSNMARAGHERRVGVRVDSESRKGSGLVMDPVIMTDTLATIKYSEIDRILANHTGIVVGATASSWQLPRSACHRSNRLWMGSNSDRKFHRSSSTTQDV